MANSHHLKSAKHKPNEFQNIYAEFLRKFGSALDADTLIPHLVTNKVIRPGDRDAIFGKDDAWDRKQMLFTEILPSKDLAAHQGLIDILVQQQKHTVAKFLSDRIEGSSLIRTPSMQSHVSPLHSHTPDFYELELRILGGKIPPTQSKILPGSKSEDFRYNTDQNRRYQIGTASSVNRSTLCRHYHPSYTYAEKLALIVSNEIFANADCNRIGGEIDRENMTSLLEYLGYTVTSYRNLTADQMLQVAAQFSATEHKSLRASYSYVIVLFTHGTLGAFYGVDEKVISAKAFFDPIVNSSALRGCPKVFIIQACRHAVGQIPSAENGFTQKEHGKARDIVHQNGQMASSGHSGSSGHSSQAVINIDHSDGPVIGGLTSALALIRDSERASYDALASKMVTSGSNTCFLFSTTPCYYSWRNQKRTSWFVEAICAEFYQNAKKPKSTFTKLAAGVRKRLQEAFAAQKNQIELPRVITNSSKDFHFFHCYK